MASFAAYLFVAACGADRPSATDGYQPSLGSVLSGPCTVEGATSECHVETGRAGNIVNCFSGAQTCHEGRWSACGEGAGGSGTLSSRDLTLVASPGPSGGGVHALTISSSLPGADAGGCLANPCNPDCLGIDTDAGMLAPEGGIVNVAVQGTIQTYASFSSGIQGTKGASMAEPYCTQGHPPGDDRVCSWDYCCAPPPDGGAGQCAQWIEQDAAAPLNARNCSKAVGADYTAGVGCADATGKIHIPVCNRGTVDSPTTGYLLLAGYSANPNAVGGTPNTCANPGSTPSEACLVNLAVNQIKAGKCLDIDVDKAGRNPTLEPGVFCSSQADFGSGNRTTLVNPAAVTNLSNTGSNNLASLYGASTYTPLAEPDGCNNYSFVFSQQGSCQSYDAVPPPPANYSFTSVATCLPGRRVQWNQFAWQSTEPSASKVTFAMKTAPLLADGGTGTFTASTPIATIQNPGGPDYSTCRMSGTYVSVTGATGTDTTKCPANLATLLGPVGSSNAVLQLDIGLISTTAIPSVQGWQITYTCVSAE